MIRYSYRILVHHGSMSPHKIFQHLFSDAEWPPLRRALWSILPTVVVIFMIEMTHLGRGVIPVPFLLLLVTVGHAGYFGGRLVGSFSGVLAAILVVHGYIEGFGPATLTGGWPYVVFGVAVFIFAGFILGRLREQRDAHYNALLETQRRDQEEPLLLASQLIKLGYYIWDPINDAPIVVSEQHLKNYGTTREQFLAGVSRSGGGFPLIHPEDRDKVALWSEKVEKGETVEMEYRVQSDQGTRWIRAIVRPLSDASGKIVKEICASLDITTQKATEAHLAEAQKLESVGRLTAGIAHDFNNLLAVILGNLELIAESRAEEHSAELIDAAIQATHRGSDLTRKLLAFGRKAALTPELIDSNTIIRDMREVIRRTLPATIEVETVLGAGLSAVEVDRSQFGNALLNLVINARDAMPETGVLTVESANVRLDEAYCDGHGAELDPGQYVMIAVSDTGSGIKPAELKRVFEPFFTTKPVDKGTGLGLPLVYGFVKQSGGSVQIYSELGEGTTVKMYFPAKGRLARPAAEPLPDPVGETLHQGRVLVVDDDPEVRRMVVRQMRLLGFEVLEAPEGSTALDVLRGTPDIRLLLTDVVMPGEMQGTDLAEAASQEMPDLKIVLMTGYAKSAVENGHSKSNGFTKLTKPVQLNELTRVVNRTLGGT
ncbi:ATP-binding protein [Antarctobacter jejuensis]|uniref:ATP-binding protein n=1 Tax=Antarctobacter jejuensis TaxID=1439938 RepID=UPI003FD0D3B1